MTNVLFVLKLVASVVGEKPLPKEPQGVNWKRVFEISLSHNITSIIAYAVLNGNFNVSEDIKQMFIKKLYAGMSVSENQTLELEKLFSAFETAGIDYMPLKGTVIRKLYPSADMRYMADGDILIKKDEHSRIAKVMGELGYSYEGESNHEYIYLKKPFMHIELHKFLIPSYNDDLYAYYGDGWKLAQKCGGSRFELGIEDNFIYLISHLAKHYRDAGVGIKSVVDIWLYRKKYELDMDYVKVQLEKLNLYEFWKNLSRMICAWFEDGEFDEVTKKMTEFSVSSGTFGSLENMVSAKALRDYQDTNIEKAEKYRYLRLAFPTYRNMKSAFPILKKYPVLLPVFWIYRLVRGVFFKRQNIEIHKNEAESINLENIKKYQEHIKSVGLDIYNGRE